MNNATILHARVAECNARSPFRQDDTFCTELRQHDTGEHVSQVRLGNSMSDEELTQAAARAGAAMEAWYSRYQQTKDQTDLDLAYHYLGVMKTLLGMRSKAFVARLEQERGLA